MREVKFLITSINSMVAESSILGPRTRAGYTDFNRGCHIYSRSSKILIESFISEWHGDTNFHKGCHISSRADLILEGVH